MKNADILRVVASTAVWATHDKWVALTAIAAAFAIEAIKVYRR